MEYSSNLKKFGTGVSPAEIEETLAAVHRALPKNRNEKVYKRCFGAIDLTSLNSTDSKDRIDRFVTRAVELPNHYPEVPNVASVCVYPVFVETAGMAIGDSGMSITSVCGGFPSSQTYLEVAETQLRSLASPYYRVAPGAYSGLLLKHSVGSLPHGSEVDVPIIYADYYYVEALMRYKKLLDEGKI